VIEEMPNGVFRVELMNKDRALAHPGAGRSRISFASCREIASRWFWPLTIRPGEGLQGS
jgi:hypothetical protein